MIKEAYAYAEEAHRGQFRNSGEPYIVHPRLVAYTLAELELDVPTIVAGLLHDVVEDTSRTIEDIEQKFGQEVAQLVDGVTKLSRIEYRSKEEQQAENLRKMFLAMARDIRVVLIKLADRLHNMQTLKHHSPQKQHDIAQETLEIYAPLAHRLGIFRLKWELEDLALRYLEPEKYYELVERIAARRQDREEQINQVIEKLKAQLTGIGIKADLSGRPKNFYSIYNKMVTQNKDLSEIFDLMAIRVIVDSVKDCYGTLGIVHTLWKPLPGRFKDYIAMPKPNMYQSLHTTVLGPRGEPFEIQIKTWEMHRTAEYGIAAHWVYKEGGKQDKDFDQKVAWLRQLLEWQLELRDAHEFMESLKIDLFSDTVFVFTPKGDVIELPAGAIPIDFAYRVHSEIGHRCIGARVNGRMVPLDYRLNNGDIVEIITSKQSGPSRDWLNMVKTSQAKTRIRQWFKREQREENAVRGRESLERELKKQGSELADWARGDKLLDVARRFNFQSVEELYAGIGVGTLTALQVIGKIKDDFLKERKAETGPPEVISSLTEARQRSGDKVRSKGVRVKGLDNMAVRFSHCCNPLPGDMIMGYVTRGRGVSIHRLDCPNLVAYRHNEPERIIEVSWEAHNYTGYQVEIEVRAMDRPRLTTDVMNTITDSRIPISSVYARANKNKQAIINLTLEIPNVDYLQSLLQKIKRVRDVTEVRRVIPSS
ncbi:MAG: bifunctional (p)ppGpp synthetase/guanosine-3',5'-bis(diphosphate) 3'-pyrophosphohydrolase [Syntrophomonadaceae bacterium]|nr:bifunctional (p)ppGpp synthetase/guanosine-3',5'-bis(diphosphate) 3'-pyrophosphohydrolase [Syntrophomonadaceae bacterium]